MDSQASMESKFSWRGISTPIQFLIRLCRYMHYHHHDLNLLSDIEEFIFSHIYAMRAQSVKAYISTPYPIPQGDEQTDSKFYQFWSELLRPHYDAVSIIFGQCATQKHLKETILQLHDLGQVHVLYPTHPHLVISGLSV